MTFAAIYLEELRAVPRGRFALAGAALLLLFVTFAAAVPGTEDSGMEAFFVVVCLFVPSGFAALAAIPMASARSTRFIQSVFTAPMRKGEYFAAKVLVPLTLGFAYLLALVPFVLVYTYHIGWPEEGLAWFGVGAGIVVYATALGAFLGVAFTGRGTAAPAVLGVAVMLLSLMGVFFLWMVLGGSYSETATEILIRLVHLGPHASLLDALGLHPELEASAPLLSLASFLVGVAGLFGAAAWIFLREQGIETWEVTPSRRGAVAALVVAVFLAPTILTGTAYAAGQENEGSYGEIFRPSEDLWMRLVERDAPSMTAGFSGLGGLWEEHLPIGETRQMDLLVLFPVEPGSTLTNVHLALNATPSLNLRAPATLTMDRLTSPEAGPIPKGLDFQAADPDTSELGMVLRVPVTVRPEEPVAPGETFYVVNLTATYRIEGRQGLEDGSAATHVRAEIPTAAAQMWLAGAPAVLACTATAIRRKLRVG